jgi:hypothetical protein
VQLLVKVVRLEEAGNSPVGIVGFQDGAEQRLFRLDRIR